MSEHLHDIDNLFKDPIEGHEEAPSAGVWEAIDKQLDKKRVIQIERKYSHLRKIAAVLIVLLAGMGIYALQTWLKPEETVQASKETSNKEQGKSTKYEVRSTKEQENRDKGQGA